MKKEILQRISKPQPACIKCGAPLQETGTHPAAVVASNGADLFDATPDEISREDFCKDCWAQAEERETFLAHWITNREAPKPSKAHTRRERAAMLDHWFHWWQEQPPSLDRDQHLYVIAHLLMKYLVLRWQRTVEPENAPPQIFFKHSNGTTICVHAAPLTTEVNKAIMEQAELFFAGEKALPQRLLPLDEQTEDDTTE